MTLPQSTSAVLNANPFKKAAFAIIAGTAMIASGCAASQGANDYSRSEVGRISRIDEGTIVASRAIQIAASNNGMLGAATGAIIGGIAGSQVGGGDDEKAIAGVVGAVGGAIAGQKISQGAGKQNGYEYKIRLDKNDEIISIVQGGDVALPNGTPIFIEYGDRARVVPQNTDIGY